jgi:hypothetical protein
MKPLKKMFGGTSIGIVLALASASVSAEDANGGAHAPSLVGTWQIEMTVRLDAADCSTSELLPYPPNPFPGLISFHEGGTLSEYASRSPPSVRSSGFGSWKQVGKYRYKARRTFMEFDPNGLLWRTMVIESQIQLGKYGSKYKEVSRLEMTDVSGNVLNFCATIEGARFNP